MTRFKGTAKLLVTTEIEVDVILDIQGDENGDVYDDDVQEALETELKKRYPPIVEGDVPWEWLTVMGDSKADVVMNGHNLEAS